VARAAVGNGDLVVGIEEGGGVWFLPPVTMCLCD
jgi:hypothetical protein